MSRGFSWQSCGLNLARFQAYSSLLRIKCGGQADESLVTDYKPCDEWDSDPDDENTSTTAQNLASFDESRLKAAFQDRLAEIVSNDKGGRYVAATILVEYSSSTTVIVARNEGLNNADKRFLRKLQELLRNVARDLSHDDESQDALWNAILTYSAVRLSIWIREFQRAARMLFDNGTEIIQDEPAVSGLRTKILNLLDASHDGSKSSLVKMAHEIWNEYDDQDFLGLRDGYHNLGKRLRLSIGFLGRLHIGFKVLVRAVQRLDKLKELTILPLPRTNEDLKTTKAKQKLKIWTLGQTFQSLALSLDDVNIKSLIGSKWTTETLDRKFNRIQTESVQFHAEIQLILYTAQNKFDKGSYSDYIGCSKRSCFLCWEFLKAYRSFKTRAGHGKIYNLWTLPDVERLDEDQVHGLVSALKAVEDLVKSHLYSRQYETPHLAKESTIGDSSIATGTPFTDSLSTLQLMCQYLTNQRTAARDICQTVSFKEELEQEYADIDEPIPHTTTNIAVTTSGLCEWCEELTNKHCPYCDRDWYCGTECARKSVHHLFRCAGQALTAADYLAKAVSENEIPDDPQTLDDYGFSRCQTWKQKSHLLGLYIGLINSLQVSRQALHAWRCNGTLVENIIAAFSSVPEKQRGDYYPWFLQNRHILDGSSNELSGHPNDVLDNALRRAITVLSTADQRIHFSELQPVEKRDAFILYAMTQDQMHPHPVSPLDLWYNFGFCTCVNEHQERKLGSLYNKLLASNKFQTEYNKSLGISSKNVPDIPTATFEELWTAHHNAKLIELMDRYNLHSERQEFAHLEQFLALRPAEPRSAVWRLTHFLAFEVNALTVPPEAAEGAQYFGFSSSLNPRTKIELSQVYKRLLAKGGPLEIDQARREGRLLEYAEEQLGKIDNAVERTLKKMK